MKKFLLLLFISALTLSINAQKIGIFQPLTKDAVIQDAKTRGITVADPSLTTVWLPRIGVALTALAVDFSEKPVLSQSLQSITFGLSYGKYSIVNDKPYCKFSVNASLLTSIKIGDTESAKLGGALTVDVFGKLIGLGIGYIDKKTLLLTTVSFAL